MWKILLLISVSFGYTSLMKKDSGLRIRIDRELREKFVALCREQDRPAAQVIREFIRGYLAKHEAVSETIPSERRKKKGRK